MPTTTKPTYVAGHQGDAYYQIIDPKTGMYKGANDWFNNYSNQIKNGTNGIDSKQLAYYKYLQGKFGLHGSTVGNPAWHTMSIKALSGDKQAQAYLTAMHMQGQTAKQGLWNGVNNNQLDGNMGLRNAYMQDNPYTSYTKAAQQKSYDAYNNMILNNKAMSAGQQAYYNQIINKWNLNDMNDPYNQQIYRANQDKTNQLNAQDIQLNQGLQQQEGANYNQMQQDRQDMASRGLSDSGIAADAYNQANMQAHQGYSQLYAQAAQNKADITKTANDQIAGIQQNQQQAAAQQAALQEKAQNDLATQQTKQDQYLTQASGYVYVNGKQLMQNGKPVRTLDYYKMNETARHNLATENNVAQGNQYKEDALTAQIGHWNQQDKYNNALLKLKGDTLNEQIKKDEETAKNGRLSIYDKQDQKKYDFYYAQFKSADAHITALQNKKNPTAADTQAIQDWNAKRNQAMTGMSGIYGGNLGNNDAPVNNSAIGGGGYSKAVTGAYSTEINQYAKQYGVDSRLVKAVASQESSLGQTSQNVMQVNGMDSSSPAASIRAGVNMLSQLLRQTGGDVKSALAAYNMGSGILTYFKAHGGYSVVNMQKFSDMQKAKHGYSVYGDPYYVQHVLKYY